MLIYIYIIDRHWYIFSVSICIVSCPVSIILSKICIFLHYLLIFSKNLIFVFTTRWKLSINFLYFIYILLHFFKINIFKLSIFIEISCMLHISQYKGWYTLQIKFLITSKWKYFIWIFIMNNNKYIAVAVSYHLFSFSE